MTQRVRGVMLTGIALLGLAGCSSAPQQTASTEDSSATPAPATTTSTTTTTTTTTSSTPTRPPAPAVLPPAADGTKLTACTDGTCEVRVDGPATIRLPKASGLTLNVGSVGDEMVFLAFTLTGNRVSVECESETTCSSTLTGSSAQGPAVVQITGYTGGRATLNTLVIHVVAVVGKSAVLRLSPA